MIRPLRTFLRFIKPLPNRKQPAKMVLRERFFWPSNGLKHADHGNLSLINKFSTSGESEKQSAGMVFKEHLFTPCKPFRPFKFRTLSSKRLSGAFIPDLKVSNPNSYSCSTKRCLYTENSFDLIIRFLKVSKNFLGSKKLSGVSA